jgi:hypothetical protein
MNLFYLHFMQDENKYHHSYYHQLTRLAGQLCFTCSYSKFRKKLNYFPTCKDFHN